MAPAESLTVSGARVIDFLLNLENLLKFFFLERNEFNAHDFGYIHFQMFRELNY